MTEEEFNQVKSSIGTYNSALKEKKLIDLVVKQDFKLDWKSWVLLLTGWPFFILGLMLNAFNLAASYLVRKNMVKRIEYKAAVSAAIPTVLTLITFVLGIIFAFIIDIKFLILAIAFPISLYLFVYYFDVLHVAIQQFRWKLIKSDIKTQLINLRRSILDMIK